jgi:hypothetical protein
VVSGVRRPAADAHPVDGSDVGGGGGVRRAPTATARTEGQVSRENIDRRAVSSVEKSNARAILGASGTGASTPARTDRSSTSIQAKEPRLMADATHTRPACEPPRAVNHTGDTQLPSVKFVWARERHTLRESGLVYYLQRASGAVKIGCTANYPQRRTALGQRHGPLCLVAWEPGYYAVEQQRHRQFARLRIDPMAEWFRVDDDLLDHILSLLAVL